MDLSSEEDPDYVVDYNNMFESEEEVEVDDYDDDEEMVMGRIEPVDIEGNIRQVGDAQRPDMLKRLFRGDFGIDNDDKSLSRLIQRRKLDPGFNPRLGTRFVPWRFSKAGELYNLPIYCGQFSQDGSLYWNCCKDYSLRVYSSQDAENPELLRRVHSAVRGRWTLTDGTINNSNTLVAFSTMSHRVTLTSALNDNVNQVLTFGDEDCSVFSLEFGSNDKIVAGLGSHQVRMLDLERPKSAPVVGHHDEDVNCVTFLDSNPNVVISGSDDTKVSVWDCRQRQQVGSFLGHTEGICGLDSRKDGVYFITNSKDQTLKLWDMRKIMSPMNAERKQADYGTGFDYRWESYRGPLLSRHPDDCSVMTYGGHTCMQTLIRCHFSPEYTGKKYIYSGSADGSVFIWHIDGTLLRKIDAPSIPPPPGSGYRHRFETCCIRDVAWHPSYPTLYASGTLTRGPAQGAFYGDDLIGGALLIMPHA